MSSLNTVDQPLVSVVITTYNHGQYLRKSINSILNQTYVNLEIIVIDDGSTDNTSEIIKEFSQVVYHYQKNAGLSNARNTGIDICHGDYVVFLDADDWLFPNGISINLQYMIQHPELAFVSGSYFKVFVEKNSLTLNVVTVDSEHFKRFLMGNYIGVPAAVMYRRSILDKFRFDESIKSCQDYDIYLNISRCHPVYHHAGLIAGYRLHSNNMSANSPLMLKEVIEAIERQKNGLNREELKASQMGKEGFIEYYTKLIYWGKLKKYKMKATKEEKRSLLRYNPNLYFRYLLNYIFGFKKPFS